MSLRKLQQHLQQQNIQLQQEIIERRQVETALQRRTGELETANKELSDFSYIVSHDLKAPLRGINNLVNWLVADYGDVFDENGREMLKLLINSVKSMDNLIHGILQYSRADRDVEKHVAIDLNCLVKEVIAMIASPDSIRIVVEQELPLIEGNKTCLQEIFQNLLSNAVKYIDKAEGNIRRGYSDRHLIL